VRLAGVIYLRGLRCRGGGPPEAGWWSPLLLFIRSGCAAEAAGGEEASGARRWNIFGGSVAAAVGEWISPAAGRG
jgi:hypothetical protein